MKKKRIFVLTSVIMVLLFMIFDYKVFYRELPISQDSIGSNAKESADSISGVQFGRLKNTASIMPSKGEKIEIVSVGKSKNVGIDITYRVIKLPDINANPEGKIVEFINLFGSPVGFVLQK